MPFRTMRDTVSWTLQFQLNQTERFAELTEGLIKGRRREFENWLDEEAKELPEEERDGLYDHYSDRYHELETEFPKSLRYSLLVAIHSQLEHFLTERCNWFSKMEKSTLKLTDLRGQGIRRCREYLIKVANRRFPDPSPEWDTILYFSELRNAIVHSNGAVRTDTDRGKKLRERIEADSLAELDGMDEIQLSEEFIPNVIETVFGFLEQFDKAYRGAHLTVGYPPPQKSRD